MNKILNLRFSLYRPNAETSLIQIRPMLADGRLTYYLPKDYRIAPRHWDARKGRAIADSRENKELKGNPSLKTFLQNVNTEITRTENAFTDIMQECQRKGIKPSIDYVREELVKRLDKVIVIDNRTFFLSFVKKYIDTDTSCLPSSKRSHRNSLKVITGYCESIHKNPRLDDITLGFYNGLVSYLKSTKHSGGDYYKPNTIGRIIKNLKTWMKAAHEQGLTNNNDYSKKAFKKTDVPVETIYLTEDELNKMYTCELEPRLRKICDTFIIAAYTGLRYSDFSRLTPQNITSNKTIKIVTQKTGATSEIPMADIIKEIVKRYDGSFPPVPSDQKFNEYIKEVARKAGISTPCMITETKEGLKYQKTVPKSELVTAHTARRSFATNAYLAGIPPISIMKITGHSTEKVFMKYIRISVEDNANQLKEHPFFNSQGMKIAR